MQTWQKNYHASTKCCLYFCCAKWVQIEDYEHKFNAAHELFSDASIFKMQKEAEYCWYPVINGY